MAGVVADQSPPEKARTDVLLFNRWTYDDVEVRDCTFMSICIIQIFFFFLPILGSMEDELETRYN